MSDELKGGTPYNHRENPLGDFAQSFPTTNQFCRGLSQQAQSLLKQVVCFQAFQEKVKFIQDTKRAIGKRGGEIAGIIFENAAYFFLKNQLQGDEVLLTPQETHELYINPNVKDAVDHTLVIPDGIILKKVGDVTHIVGACEYTTTPSGELKYPTKKQMNRIQYAGVIRDLFVDRSTAWKEQFGKYIHDHYSQLSAKVEFHQNEYKPYPIFINTPGFPFSGGELRQIVQAMEQDLKAV